MNVLKEIYLLCSKHLDNLLNFYFIEMEIKLTTATTIIINQDTWLSCWQLGFDSRYGNAIYKEKNVPDEEEEDR